MLIVSLARLKRLRSPTHCVRTAFARAGMTTNPKRRSARDFLFPIPLNAAPAWFNLLFAAESNARAAADDKLIEHCFLSVDGKPMPESEVSRSGVKRTALT